MSYVRGHDDRDKLKDFNDKARRIIADGKQVRRMRNYNFSNQLSNPFPVFQQVDKFNNNLLLTFRRRQQTQQAKDTERIIQPDTPSINSTTLFNQGRLYF